jgi:hypothetical protein
MPVTKQAADSPFDTAGTRVLMAPATTENFGWLGLDNGHGDAFVCSTAACEVMIPWSFIYGTGGRPATPSLLVFARLVNHDGTAFSNQTLPQDNGGTEPAAVTVSTHLDVMP